MKYETFIKFNSQLGAFVLLALPNAVAEPGYEAKHDMKITEATLYLVDIQSQGKDLIDATFAWLPADLEKECLGKDAQWCEGLNDCWTFPTEQKCGKNLSDCHEIIRPECERFGKAVDPKRPRAKGAPTLMLKAIADKQRDKSSALVKKWKIGFDSAGKFRMDEISAKRSIRVRWE
jgi:hypothetical protein